MALSTFEGNRKKEDIALPSPPTTYSYLTVLFPLGKYGDIKNYTPLLNLEKNTLCAHKNLSKKYDDVNGFKYYILHNSFCFVTYSVKDHKLEKFKVYYQVLLVYYKSWITCTGVLLFHLSIIHPYSSTKLSFCYERIESNQGPKGTQGTEE